MLLQTAPIDWTQIIVSGLPALGGFIRETGFLGVGILLVVALWKRILVLGWQYEEETLRAGQEKDRADRLQELLDRLTLVTSRNTRVTEHVVRRRAERERDLDDDDELRGRSRRELGRGTVE